MTIDITQIVVALIGVLSAVITAFVVPWIKSRTTANQQEIIATAARTAVYAAQQMYGANEGDKKKAYALESLTDTLMKYGITLAPSDLSDAIEAALKKIKTALTGNWAEVTATSTGFVGGACTTASKATPDDAPSSKSKIVVRRGKDITMPRLSDDGFYAL